MPLEEGKEFNVTVEHESDLGDGMVKIQDVVVFLPAVGEGSEFKVRVTKSYNKVAFAQVLNDKETKT